LWFNLNNRSGASAQVIPHETGGTGFWHELYSMRSGFEAMHVDVAATYWISPFFAGYQQQVSARGAIAPRRRIASIAFEIARRFLSLCSREMQTTLREPSREKSIDLA
jgi:hypothetical protein